jgi:hypothetical protein
VFGVSHGPRWAYLLCCVCVYQSYYVRTVERLYKNKVSSCRKLELVSLSCHHTAKMLIRNNFIDGVADVHVIGNTSVETWVATKKELNEHLPLDKWLAIKSALEAKHFSCVGFFEVLNLYTCISYLGTIPQSLLPVPSLSSTI